MADVPIRHIIRKKGNRGYVPFYEHSSERREIPVDMFGRTVTATDIQMDVSSHVETVVLLSKLNAKQHIVVELNLDELDLTAAESKATYDEIKAYVLEKHGLKVSSLYISQVKRKC